MNNTNEKKNKQRDIGIYILILVILLRPSSLLMSQKDTQSLKYSDVRSLFESEKVKEFVVEGDTLILSLHEPYNGSYSATYKLYSFFGVLRGLARADRQSVFQKNNRRLRLRRGLRGSLVALLCALPGAYRHLRLLWYFMMNRSAGGDRSAIRFGKARTRLGVGDKKVTFADVAGSEEEKEELQEIVEFLKNPKGFIEVGARIPKGVLLVGPPGTGKTLLAKAVAGEAGVQFLSISGSDFVELYVGVGASRVRDLFEQAKKAAPSIIFIDEIDAVGRQRGAGLGGGHDEREQTLNQLLVEMDGFGTNEGVIVMAATNRQDILDKALLRPARFRPAGLCRLSRHKGQGSYTEGPQQGQASRRGREFEHYSKVHHRLYRRGSGEPAERGGPADRQEAQALHNHVRDRGATIKVIAGPEKKSKVVSDKEKRLKAYHEAGHAVAMASVEHADPVHQISIIPRA
jgi:cell division protease FtsH